MYIFVRPRYKDSSSFSIKNAVKNDFTQCQLDTVMASSAFEFERVVVAVLFAQHKLIQA